MSADFYSQTYNKLESFRKALLSFEQTKRISAGAGNNRNQLGLRNISESEIAESITQISRLSEDLMRICSQQAYASQTFESISKEASEQQHDALLQETVFWSFLRQVANYKQSGKKNLEEVSR